MRPLFVPTAKQSIFEWVKGQKDYIKDGKGKMSLSHFKLCFVLKNGKIKEGKGQNGKVGKDNQPNELFGNTKRTIM